jgi:carboxymethylenebutenolidase
MATSGRMIKFEAEGGKGEGYLTSEGGDESRPGLIVVHEWWGLTDHIKEIADRFAAEGFVVIAPDLYGGKATKDPDEAGKLMQGLDQKKAVEILGAAVEQLKSQEKVRPDSIGITGFCMGGTYALLLPCVNRDIKASAPFYGDVPPDDVLKDLSAPVLCIGAENDPWITKEKMRRLEEALKKFNKAGEVKVYNGVGHAFFNDTRPEAYDREAARDAWANVLRFFRENL